MTTSDPTQPKEKTNQTNSFKGNLGSYLIFGIFGGEIALLIFQGIIFGLIEAIFGEEVLIQFECFFIEPNSFLGSVIGFVQFLYRCVITLQLLCLATVLGVVVPIIGIAICYLYYSVLADFAKNKSVKEYLIKNPISVLFWFIGIIIGYQMVTYIGYYVGDNQEAYYVIVIGLCASGSIYKFCEDTVMKDKNHKLYTYLPYIFKICHLFAGIGFGGAFYFCFITCFRDLFLSQVIYMLTDIENSFIWVYFYYGLRGLKEGNF